MSAPDSATELLQMDVERRPQGVVYRMTVSRPERLNIVNSQLLGRLEGALATVADDDEARAVVLSGAGRRAWIGGADIREMVGLGVDDARDFITGLHRVCAALRRLTVPVLARIDGYCLGAGLEIAACCDLRVCTKASRFGMPEVHVGIPSVIEAALLPRLIGYGRARDLVITGRLISAAEAASWGLVEIVATPAELDRVVEERLGQILEAGPRAVRAQKQLCHGWEELPLAEAIEAGIDAFEKAYEDDEPRRYMQRFLKRPRD
jgi:enoyl-CoA hydratase/carnithine racemase